jgi:acetyl esterase/lipase
MIYSSELEQHVAEAREFNEQLAQFPPLSIVTLEEIREARALMDSPEGPFSGEPPVLPVTEGSIPGPAGPIPTRVIRPERVDAVYLDMHGGAWMIGSPRMDDGENDQLARACELATVSIDYRMAPEHTIEDAMDDCEAAAVWLVEHAAEEFGTDRLLIGGGSAGGHLAAMTLLRLRERHQAAGRYLGANLVFGAYDLSGTPSTRLRTSGILGSGTFAGVARHVHAGRRGDDLRDPAISPLYADLSGLPPALFTVGALDPLLDDSLFMAARWAAAGNEAQLAVYPESDHAFTAFPTGMARAAHARVREWVRDRLSTAAGVV